MRSHCCFLCVPWKRAFVTPFPAALIFTATVIFSRKMCRLLGRESVITLFILEQMNIFLILFLLYFLFNFKMDMTYINLKEETNIGRGVDACLMPR